MNQDKDTFLLETFLPDRLLANDSHAKIEKVSLIQEILFVIVLYEMNVKDSIAFKSLNSISKKYFTDYSLDILICDNSFERTLNSIDVTNNSWANIFYIHDKKNPGISLSYNRAVELAASQDKKWMLVLDQDTDIPENGLCEYEAALIKWPDFPIYAPKLYSNNLLLSPCRYFMYRGTNLSFITPGIHKMEGKNVLNSGLLIKVKAFLKAGGYDEQVSLYFSDFIFFNRLKNHYNDFVVIECCLTHNLSSSDYGDFSFASKRFKLYCTGARAAVTDNNGIFSYCVYFITVGLRSIKMSVRFNNFQFIKIFGSCFLTKRNEN